MANFSHPLLGSCDTAFECVLSKPVKRVRLKAKGYSGSIPAMRVRGYSVGSDGKKRFNGVEFLMPKVIYG